MDKLRRYLLDNLSVVFFSIFLPLFAIASVIFMIKLATYTAIISLNLAEMGKLYLFILPELLFYTLPLAFFIAGILTLYRLSNDSEMVVVFSLGIAPRVVVRMWIAPALILSMVLLFDFLIVTPYVNVLSKNFLENKKTEAKFNLSASEFGHHFGNWMLFIKKTSPEGNFFEDIVLFNNEENKEILIRAQSAQLVNQQGLLRFQLNHGESFTYNREHLRRMHFERLYINDILNITPFRYRGALDYWTNQEKKGRKQQLLINNTLLSLFPSLSLFLVVGLGIVHARHQKRWIYLWIFLSIVLFYALGGVLQHTFGFHTIWIVALGWVMGTYAIYRQLVGKRF